MFAVVVNAVAILICATVGIFIKSADKFKKPIINSISLAVFFIAIAGCVSGLNDERSNPLLFVISLVIGTIIGEKIDIDGNFTKLGDALGKRFGGGSSFAGGFVTSSFIFCIGAMAIVGSFESGLRGNHTILFTKSVIDGVTAAILASTLGSGVIFSAFAVLIYQGAWTAFAELLAPLITNDSIRELSTVGNVLIAAIGLDMLDIKKVSYANMLPAIFIPLFYYMPFTQKLIASILEIF